MNAIMTEQALATTNDPQTALAYRHELSVEELVLQVKKIHDVMSKVMRPGLDGHYGIVPGTKKPTLLKAGAELLCMLFRLAPEYTIEKERPGEHLDVVTTCTLRHIPTGMVWGTGVGSCTTRESKYAYRKAGRTCPKCDKADTIIKGKAEYGGGWLCFAKRGGCGEKFPDGDRSIEGQQTEERVANPDLADSENSVLKMSNKRALVAAVLNVTAASETFTQDMEDFSAGASEDESREPAARTTNAGATPTNGTAPQPRADGSALVIGIETKTGKRQDGTAWTAYVIKLDDGRAGTTFDEGLAKAAQAAKDAGVFVIPTLEKKETKRGPVVNLTRLVDVEVPGDEAAGSITAEQVDRLLKTAQAMKWTDDQLEALYGRYEIAFPQELPAARYDEVLQHVKQGPGA